MDTINAVDEHLGINESAIKEKCCSRCGKKKIYDDFIKARNICKECHNKRNQDKYKAAKEDNEGNKTCICCNLTKSVSSFMTRRNNCKDCNNEMRRKKYEANLEHRAKLIQTASKFKHEKVVERQRVLKTKQEQIGEGNTQCKYCSEIKSNDSFRHNRLKCKNCERDEPVEKFKRIVRSRIWSALRKKTKRTIEYLGMTSFEYLNWILSYDENYNLDNRGKEWHIDHVIPLARFNLDDENEQLVAFNWRNTMPLSCKENLAKNKKILKPQIEQHLEKLKSFHREKKIELPQVFIDLFAKHLVDGDPLKQSLPLTLGNLR